MARTPKLTDTQAILLSHAAQRDSGSLYPLADTITAPKPAIVRSVASLIGRGLAEERETDDRQAVSRTDGDLRYGIFITAAGMTVIGVGEAAPDDEGITSSFDAPSPTPTSVSPERQSKSAAVVALLQREGGATLPELIATTGWLPHTTRAALTGLRKKGHAIERGKRGEETCYRIARAA